MKTQLWITMSMAALSVSCGGVVINPMPDIPETVEYDTIRLDYGRDDGIEATPDGDVTRQGALIGEPSELAELTGATVSNTNALIYGILNQVDEIVATPPADYADEVWTWELSRPLRGEYVKFVLQRMDPIGRAGAQDAVRFRLEYGRSRVDSATIYDGEFYTFGRDDEGRQRGAGTLRFYFDDVRRYDPSSAEGSMRVSFRSNRGVRQVRSHLLQVKGARTQADPLDAIYGYVQFPDGYGRLSYFGRGDIVGRDGEDEFASVSAAWSPDKVGRVVAKVERGSLGGLTLGRRQCWDADQVVNYQLSTPANDGDGGAEGACDPVLLGVDLSVPEFSPPTGIDPEIPGPHPRE